MILDSQEIVHHIVTRKAMLSPNLRTMDEENSLNRKIEISDTSAVKDGQLLSANDVADKTRRATFGGLEDGVRRGNSSTAPGEPFQTKTPAKQRFSLGAASSYYFKHVPKTPLEQTVAEKVKLNRSLQPTLDESFQASPHPQESSYLSSSSSSSEGDMLNRSVLSDTTELTASNFVLAAASRQMMLSHKMNRNKTPKEVPKPEMDVAGQDGLRILESETASFLDDSPSLLVFSPAPRVDLKRDSQSGETTTSRNLSLETENTPPSKMLLDRFANLRSSWNRNGPTGNSESIQDNVIRGPAPWNPTDRRTPPLLSQRATPISSPENVRQLSCTEPLSERLSLKHDRPRLNEVEKSCQQGKIKAFMDIAAKLKQSRLRREQDASIRRQSLPPQLDADDESQQTHSKHLQDRRLSLPRSLLAGDSVDDQHSYVPVQEQTGESLDQARGVSGRKMKDIEDVEKALSPSRGNRRVPLQNQSLSPTPASTLRSARNDNLGKSANESFVSESSLNELFDDLIPNRTIDLNDSQSRKDGYSVQVASPVDNYSIDGNNISRTEYSGTPYTEKILSFSALSSPHRESECKKESVWPDSSNELPLPKRQTSSVPSGEIPMEIESFDAVKTSPFPIRPRAESRVTPTKIGASPRRIIDSPARNTRSACKQRSRSPLLSSIAPDSRVKRSLLLDESISTDSHELLAKNGSSSLESRLTPTKLARSPGRVPVYDSPAHNTRSANKTKSRSPSLSRGIFMETPEVNNSSIMLTAIQSSGLSSSTMSGNLVSQATDDFDAGSSHSVSVNLEASSYSDDKPSPHRVARNESRSPDPDDTATSDDLRSLFSDISPCNRSASSGTVVDDEEAVLRVDSKSLHTQTSSVRIATDPSEQESTSIHGNGLFNSTTSHYGKQNVPANKVVDYVSPTRFERHDDEITKKDSSSTILDFKSSFSSPSTDTQENPRCNANHLGPSCRNGSSSEIGESGNFAHSFIHEEGAFKRERDSHTEKSTEELRFRRAASRKSILSSVLRKPGSARKNIEGGRKVEFGSPEIAEFNTSSPSMNLTPMPTKKLKRSEGFHDDTVEIEEDMHALLKGIPPRSNFAFRDSEGTKEEIEILESSLVSSQDGHHDQENTTDLESSLRQVMLAPGDGSTESISFCEPKTTELELDMADLLQATASEVEYMDCSPEVSPVEMKNEEENTVELEINMEAFLTGFQNGSVVENDAVRKMHASPSTIENRRRRSILLSHRFSLTPARHADVSEFSTAIEHNQNRVEFDNCASPESLSHLHTDVLETTHSILTKGDFLEMPTADMRIHEKSPEVLVEACRSLREVDLADAIEGIVFAVCDQVKQVTESEVTLSDSFDYRSRDEISLGLRKLYHGIRHGDRTTITRKMDELVCKLRLREAFKWNEWLTSVVETLKPTLTEKLASAKENLLRLCEKDDLAAETQSLLLSFSRRSVTRARLKTFYNKKVRLKVRYRAMHKHKTKFFSEHHSELGIGIGAPIRETGKIEKIHECD